MRGSQQRLARALRNFSVCNVCVLRVVIEAMGVFQSQVTLSRFMVTHAVSGR